MKRFQSLLAGLCCAASLMFTAPAYAEAVKIIVPFAAGGPVDQLARILAAALGPKLEADVIVEDRGGAGGALGSEMVARAAPDGKTMLLASLGSQVLSPILKAPANYDPIKGFEPVMLVGAVPSLLVAAPQPDVATLKDLIAKAKEKKLVYGSAGPGTTMNIAVEMLNSAAAIKITHVPYRGAAPAINDLIGGHIDTLNADLPVLLPMVKAGKVKALALFATERSPLLPDLPTTAELGRSRSASPPTACTARSAARPSRLGWRRSSPIGRRRSRSSALPPNRRVQRCSSAFWEADPAPARRRRSWPAASLHWRRCVARAPALCPRAHAG